MKKLANSKPPALVILNIPELGQAPPWFEMQAAFLNKDQNIIVTTVMLLLIGQMASARRAKETNSALDSLQCKFHDGGASVADETLSWLLKLLRGDGEKLPESVKRLFPLPTKQDKS